MVKSTAGSLTKQQLREIMEIYHARFPEWSLLPESNRFVRVSGPVLQQIGFEALRSGVYRPSSCIRVLIAPDVVVLASFLDIRHREISLREHPRKIDAVVVAMEQQFQPAIREPLDHKEVKRLCASNDTRNLYDLAALVALHAYDGDIYKAKEYTNEAINSTSSFDRRLHDWELDLVRFMETLRDLLDSGEYREKLEGRARSVLQRHEMINAPVYEVSRPHVRDTVSDCCEHHFSTDLLIANGIKTSVWASWARKIRRR